MKVFVIGIIVCLQTSLINISTAQRSECNDQLAYEVIEGINDVIDIEVNLDGNSQVDFLLKLYSAGEGGEFISQMTISKSKNTITFKGLSNNKVYLIQAISDECTITLGGMEGIKVEKE